MFKKIAVAFDESPEAQRSFLAALELAKLSGGAVTLITVLEELPAYVSYVTDVAPDVPHLLKKERQAYYEDLQHRAKERAEQAGVAFAAQIVAGDEIDALLRAIAEIRPHLLVVGLRRDPGGLSSVMGGTAHRLALHAACDVLGVR
jgi:nucleotide-binding universal stress UspA family protein